METNIFNEEELKEIEQLFLHGGISISPQAQMECSNEGCIDTNGVCTHKGCIVQKECTEPIDGKCTNSGCLVPNTGCTISGPQAGCICGTLG